MPGILSIYRKLVVSKKKKHMANFGRTKKIIKNNCIAVSFFLREIKYVNFYLLFG